MAGRKNCDRWEVVDIPEHESSALVSQYAVVDWEMLRAIMEHDPPPAVWPVLDYFIGRAQRRINAGYGAHQPMPVRGGYASLASRCKITGSHAEAKTEAAVQWLGMPFTFGDGRSFCSGVLWLQSIRNGVMYFTVPFFHRSGAINPIKYGNLVQRSASRRYMDEIYSYPDR